MVWPLTTKTLSADVGLRGYTYILSFHYKHGIATDNDEYISANFEEMSFSEYCHNVATDNKDSTEDYICEYCNDGILHLL